MLPCKRDDLRRGGAIVKQSKIANVVGIEIPLGMRGGVFVKMVLVGC